MNEVFGPWGLGSEIGCENRNRKGIALVSVECEVPRSDLQLIVLVWVIFQHAFPQIHLPTVVFRRQLHKPLQDLLLKERPCLVIPLGWCKPISGPPARKGSKGRKMDFAPAQKWEKNDQKCGPFCPISRIGPQSFFRSFFAAFPARCPKWVCTSPTGSQTSSPPHRQKPTVRCL